MIEQKDVISFFDRCAPNWDAEMIRNEPVIRTILDNAGIRAGVDVVSFSGDKLLGGPQAGIIIGKKEYIDRFKSHPLARAMRVDKMTLAALRATLHAYLDPAEAVREIPTLSMLAVDADALHAKAALLQKVLRRRTIRWAAAACRRSCLRPGRSRWTRGIRAWMPSSVRCAAVCGP